MRAQYEWNIYGRSSIIDHRSLSSRVEYFFRYIHGKFVNLSFVGVGSWQEKCVFIVCTSYVNKLSCVELRARASSTGSWSVTPPVPGTGTPMVAAASVAPVQRLRQRFFSSSSSSSSSTGSQPQESWMLLVVKYQPSAAHQSKYDVYHLGINDRFTCTS